MASELKEQNGHFAHPLLAESINVMEDGHMGERNLDAANKVRLRAAQERWANRLRKAGWTCHPPEDAPQPSKEGS